MPVAERGLYHRHAAARVLQEVLISPQLIVEAPDTCKLLCKDMRIAEMVHA